jgi:hypothetical protein
VISNKLLISLLENPLKETAYYFCYVAMASQSGNAWAQMKAHEQMQQQQQTANTDLDKGKQASQYLLDRGPRMHFPEDGRLGANMMVHSRSAADYQLRQR